MCIERGGVRATRGVIDRQLAAIVSNVCGARFTMKSEQRSATIR